MRGTLRIGEKKQAQRTSGNRDKFRFDNKIYTENTSRPEMTPQALDCTTMWSDG